MTVSELPPRAEVVDALLWVVLPAAGAAAGVYLLSALLARRLTARWQDVMSAAGVLALGAALAAGNQFRGVFPWLPDGRWWHWAGPAVGLVVLTGLLTATALPTAVGLLARFAAALVWLVAVTPPGDRTWLALVPAAAGLAVGWLYLGAAAAGDGWGVTGAVALAALSGSAVLLHHRTLGFADLLTAVGVALATLAALARLNRANPSAAGVGAVTLVGLLALGRALADSAIPPWVFVLAGGLPLLQGLRMVPAVGRRPLALLGLTAAGAAVAVVAAMLYEPLRFGDDW